ncbi:MAG: translation initiation factor eIF-1A [Candidatus Pacearchaeota archaeon]|jgi:translation initiation factor 1A
MKPKSRNKPNRTRNALPSQPQEIIRVKTPRDNEVLGIVEQRVGANRMIIKCLDDKERNCRIPGALRRTLWIRPGDTVIVKPWEFEGDKKGDIIFKYTPAAVEWLKKRGFLKEDSASEF